MPPVAHQFAMGPVLVGETVVQGSVIGRCRGEGVGAVGKLYFGRYMVEGGFPAVNAYDFGFERRGELYAQAGGAGTPGMVVVQVNVTSLVGVIAIFYESELGHHLFTALSQKGEEAVDEVQVASVLFQCDALVEGDSFAYPVEGQGVAFGYGVDEALCRLVFAGDKGFFGFEVEGFGLWVPVTGRQ